MNSNKKYKLLEDETIKVGTKTLYRIKALRDFGDVKKGDLGGYIEKENNLSHEGTSWIYEDAKVFGYAWVFDDAEVYGNAWVFDDAQVYGNARVGGNARVFRYAHVSGNARVYGDAQVCGDAQVYGNAKVYGYALVFNDAYIRSNDDIASVSYFGRENRTTTFYLDKDRNIHVVCGCFSGTLEEFKSKVKETHGDTYYSKEYLMIADLMELRFKNREEK